MIPKITLETVSREDIERINLWLEDGEISDSWYGLDGDGNAVHIG